MEVVRLKRAEVPPPLCPKLADILIKEYLGYWIILTLSQHRKSTPAMTALCYTSHTCTELVQDKEPPPYLVLAPFPMSNV